MKGTPPAAVLVAALLAGAGCRPAAPPEARGPGDSVVATREARLAASLAKPDSGAERGAPIARWLLPADLAEISGLALMPDARLFAHGDEEARIAEIDYRRGVVVKRFLVGPPLQADVEAITAANDVLFLLTSSGKLYEFREGGNNERVPYIVHDTRLGHECEFESLAFDPATHALLLACKTVGKNSLRNFLVIYRWKLQGGSGPRLSRLAVPLARVIGSNGWKEFHPSDMAVDPSSGNYVLIAAQEKALVVITPKGAPVFSRPIPKGLEQPEGIAITQDSILLIGDEAAQGPASISLYRWP